MYVLFIQMKWNVAVKWVSPLLHTQCVSIQISANERGMGVACKNYRGPGSPKRGLGPDCVAYVAAFLCSIIICPLYK